MKEEVEFSQERLWRTVNEDDSIRVTRKISTVRGKPEKTRMREDNN